MGERNDNRTSEEIRRDIEVARADLRGTVDALERKLSLGQIVDEVWGRVGNGRSATSAVSSVGGVFRDHPVPLALMGLGVAWLAVDKVAGSEGDDENGHAAGTFGRAEGRVGPYRGHETRRASGHASSDRSAMDKVKGVASDATGEVSGLADKAVGGAWDAASQGTKKAKDGFRSAMDEQPLALGAVAFGLGLASGLAVPTTSWEDRMMGRAAATVKDEAGSLAKEAADAIATEAKEAVKDRMDDRDLDPASMKKRLTESRERTRESLSE